MGKHERKKGENRILKIIVVTLLLLVTLIVMIAGIGVGYIYIKLGEINIESIDETAVGITEETQERLAGYRHIALLGIDSRADDYGIGNRSDCIIIASLNQKTKDIKLISVYRDTYMQVDCKGKEILDKVTHAYSYGGAQNTLKALNTNLDLNITEYITVNFDALIAAIDAIGGVTIDIDSAELKYINDYITVTSQSSGVKSSKITTTGTQLLDGVQAVSYSRIRYTEGGDYKRTERMRTVIEAMLIKAKTLSIGKLSELVNEILPRVSTNISTTEILSLVPSVASFNITDSLGWPYNIKGVTLDRWYGVPVTLETNVIKLHQEAFGELEYEPSQKIKDISLLIQKRVGK